MNPLMMMLIPTIIEYAVTNQSDDSVQSMPRKKVDHPPLIDKNVNSMTSDELHHATIRNLKQFKDL